MSRGQETRENEALIRNIRNVMQQRGKRQVHIAQRLEVQRQTVHKMLNGTRMITAVELKEIADFLEVSADTLLELPDTMRGEDVFEKIIRGAGNEEAKEELRAVKRLIDLYPL